MPATETRGAVELAWSLQTGPGIEAALQGIALHAGRVSRRAAAHPWDLWRDGDRIHLTLRHETLATAPDDVLLQCGAALENIRIALSHAGAAHTVILAPLGDASSSVAMVQTTGLSRPNVEDDLLFEAIEHGEVVQRRGGISPALIGLLRHAARTEGAWLVPIGRCSRSDTSLNAVIGTLGSTRADWIRAGEALQRVTLHASVQGMRVRARHAPGRDFVVPRVGGGDIPDARGEPKVVARFETLRGEGSGPELAALSAH